LFDRYPVNHGNVQRKSRRTVVEAAKKEIGVRESTENSSERIDQYCAYAGINRAPWCAAFVSWCFGQAGYAQPRTAWSPALFPAARRVGIPNLQNAEGLVAGIYIPSLGRVGHCGIIEFVRGDFLVCIEGNTNANGSRNGDGVYRRMRHKRTIHCLADWTVGSEED
jgi:hypothetical protein